MYLIATDEAGYGPKLGPLVVAASLWELPDSPGQAADLAGAFARLAKPTLIDGVRYVVDDSKAVFQPASAGKKASAGYSKLQTVTAAGCRWCSIADDRLDLVDALARSDREVVRSTPWLESFAAASIDTTAATELTERWCEGPAVLRALSTRVLTAAAFNQICDSGMNKSDLLSDVTLRLVRSLVSAVDRSAADASDETAIDVFCDRHGGRRYYAGVLQSVFGGSLVRVIEETKRESSYRMPIEGGEMKIRFTVKGDSFTPVAFSSMVAKYLREKAMESLNGYFIARHHGRDGLRPTAGYPVDAERFLQQIGPTVLQEKIELRRLVRAR